MKILFLVILAIICFSLVWVGGKKYNSTALYALAIGGAVNANFFHAGSYPINCFGLNFGIDSIIYTLFIFCVIVMYIKQGRTEAYILTASSIIAVLFSAIMQLLADLLTIGSNVTSWIMFANFVVSCVASLIAIISIVELLHFLRNKKFNQYLKIILCLIIATVINSIIYYSVSCLLYGVPQNFDNLLIASLIGKSIAIIISIISFAICNCVINYKNNKNNLNNPQN